MNLVLIGILLYVAFQFVLGFLVSRGIRTESDYLLAGRSLGYLLATFSIFATWFGAESCIGSAGAAYAEGLAGVAADPFGYGICLLLMGAAFAVPLWKMNLTTIADFFRVRFSRGTERVTALLMIPTSLLWAAAQIRAFGQILSASSDLDVVVAITLSAAVVIAYTVLGGMLADAMTDVAQGIVLIAGLIVLASVITDSLGVEEVAFRISSAGLFRPSESAEGLSGFLRTAEAWAIPVCGSVIAQELVSRVLASRSPVVARRSSLMAGVLYISIGLIPLAIGLLGFSMVPNLDHEEQVLMTMARQFLPTGLYILFAGALVSAILSTVDSALLAASAVLSHNLIDSAQKPEKSRLLTNRLGVAGMGIAAYFLAVHAEGVYNLVKEAASFGSAGIFAAFTMGMFTKTGNGTSAVGALVSGTIVWIVGHYVLSFEYSYLISLGTSFLAYWTASLFQRPIAMARRREDPRL